MERKIPRGCIAEMLTSRSRDREVDNETTKATSRNGLN